MPDTKKKYEDKNFQNFLRQISVVGQTESNNNYKPPVNPNSSATGKYQYTKAHLPQIKKVAAEKGIKIDSMEDFRNSSVAQEAYFVYDQYKAFEWAKNKISDKNPFGYNMAELAVLRHFQGEGEANKILSSGKHKGPDSIGNPGTKEYIENRFRPALKESGFYTDAMVDKNMARTQMGNGLTNADNLKIQDKYFKELKVINDMPVDDLQKNILKNELNDQYFREGNLQIVNNKIMHRNNNKHDRLKDLRLKANKVIIGENGTTRPAINDSERKELDSLEKQYSSMKYSQDPEFSKRFTKDPLNDLSFYNQRYIDSLPPVDLEAEAAAQEAMNGNAATANTNTSGTSTVTAKTAPAPKTAITDEEMQQMFSDGIIADEQFVYNPGNFNIPVEALGYGALAMMGVKAGNVDMPVRNEEVSEAMKNYGAELSKISKMGLPPEVEGDLKMKLAEAYQTGITNISRASNGNRNLILGNQGQLDSARMSGIVDIAMLDMDRRDKAMAAYGEVQKYINEFDTNRDVANNERAYREAEKKQIAGATLAQQGFSSLIDSLEYSRANAPGSANDMMKQYMMFSISGINPNAKEGDPGSATYAAQVKEKNDLRKSEKEQLQSFMNNSNKEDRERFKSFVFDNPNMDPNQNPEFKFDNFKSEFDLYSGITSGKSDLADAQGTIPEDMLPVDNGEFPTLNALPMNEKNIRKTGPAPADGYVSGDEYQNIAAFTNSAPTTLIAQQNPIISNAISDSETVAQKMERLNKEAEMLLANDNSTKVLDNLITTTESSTNKMKNQLNSTY